MQVNRDSGWWLWEGVRFGKTNSVFSNVFVDEAERGVGKDTIETTALAGKKGEIGTIFATDLTSFCDKTTVDFARRVVRRHIRDSEGSERACGMLCEEGEFPESFNFGFHSVAGTFKEPETLQVQKSKYGG